MIGPNADDKQMLWGNYNGTPVRTISILDGIKTKLSPRKIIYDKGCDLVEDKVTISYFDQCSWQGKQGFKATYWNTPDRSGLIVTTEYVTSAIKKTTAGQHEFASGVKLEGFSATYETEFTAKVSEEIVFKGGATGHYELIVNGEPLVTYDNWRTLLSRKPFMAEAGRKYKIEIRFAQLNNWQANIEFDFGKEVDVDYTALTRKLQGVDIVIFVGGLSGKLEGEEMPVSYPGFKGGDRTDIELPAVQRNCIKALKDAGKKIIFVNCSGSAIALTPETGRCEAILQAWYAGESGGQAVADVLFGDYNPSGKLPITFYKSSDQLPDFENYTMKNRTYRFMTDALFPFGHGLSYTSFSIGKATTAKSVIDKNETITLNIPVANIGKRDGTEIVQVYIRKVGDNDGPVKTLRGFQRLNVPAGKTGSASITLPPEAFAFFDRNSGKMEVAPGQYEVMYGNSSDNKNLKSENITIK